MTNQAQAQTLSREVIAQALARANATYIARKGSAANLKNGTNPDITEAGKIWGELTDAQINAIHALGVTDSIIAGTESATNVKKAKRLPQLLAFIVSGDVRYLQSSALTAALEIAALYAGAKSRVALAYSATGIGDENTSDEVNTALVNKVRKALGRVGATSEPTQNSVTFSKGGLAEMLGIARKGGRSDLPTLDRASPIGKVLCERIASLSDLDIERLTEGKRKGK